MRVVSVKRDNTKKRSKINLFAFKESKRGKIHTISRETIAYIDNANAKVRS